MQRDMHYYATCYLAMKAGFTFEEARTVATASQWVDDHDKTGHHPYDLKHNADMNDQKRVWVPFHFLPGDPQNLVCVKNGPFVPKLKEWYVAEGGGDLFLLGILSHIVADTYSHHGFVGLSVDYNMIEGGSLSYASVQNQEIFSRITDKLKRFFTDFADIVRLGHGSAGTLPDRPYLSPWKFRYQKHETGVDQIRNNLFDFEEYCHDIFLFYARLKNKRDVTLDEERLHAMLAAEKTLDDREQEWKRIIQEEFACDANYEEPRFEDSPENAKGTPVAPEAEMKFVTAADKYLDWFNMVCPLPTWPFVKSALQMRLRRIAGFFHIFF